MRECKQKPTTIFVLVDEAALKSNIDSQASHAATLPIPVGLGVSKMS
jgi:hypothetical protein